MPVLGLKPNNDLIVSFIDSGVGGNKVSVSRRQIPPSAECPEIQMKTKSCAGGVRVIHLLLHYPVFEDKNVCGQNDQNKKP